MPLYATVSLFPTTQHFVPNFLVDRLVPDLVVVLAVEDSEDSKEQVQDIKIETDTGRNLLLNVVMSHY